MPPKHGYISTEMGSTLETCCEYPFPIQSQTSCDKDNNDDR